jgi:hypothetical protein
MKLIILRTPHGLDESLVRERFKVFTDHKIDIAFIPHPSADSFMKNALPLTKVSADALKQKEISAEKFQHCLAAELIKKENLPYAWVMLDSIGVTDMPFVLHAPETKMRDADLSIFTAPNFPASGIQISGTPWVYLDSEDPTRNNIITAYLITLQGAKRLYSLRNEILNNGKSFAHSIQEHCALYSADRIIAYATFHSVVTKPFYVK